MNRRKFISGISSLGIASAVPFGALPVKKKVKNDELIIDIHQHMFYHGRTDKELLEHQKSMGVTHTILLPAGRPAFTKATHYGHSNGLQAQCGVNIACYNFAKDYPDSFSFAANEVPDIPDAVDEVERYLKLGAKMIAEVKFGLACDSPYMQKYYELAAEYDVPILMHWQYETFNLGFERFYKMLEKYPKTNFIGHAQTWAANIDKNQENHPYDLYPKGTIEPGGLTDKYLSDYENMYSDLSAGSGLNAYTRDDDFISDFFDRHQDKLLFGSDCADSKGYGEACDGAGIISVIRRLSKSKTIERKILYENASRLFKIDV